MLGTHIGRFGYRFQHRCSFIVVRESRGEGIGGIEWWWWFVFGRESFLAWFQAEVDVYRCWFLFDHWRVFITWFSGLRKAGYCSLCVFYPRCSLFFRSRSACPVCSLWHEGQVVVLESMVELPTFLSIYFWLMTNKIVDCVWNRKGERTMPSII